MAFEPVALNLPTYPFKLSAKDGKYFIFDELRKKHLALTPEEWVRQHFIMYLIKDRFFPKSLIQIEAGLKLNTLQKRTDIVVFNKKGERIMVVECKAPHVAINQTVFDQAAQYNSIHKTPWIVVSNGMNHHFSKIDHKKKEAIFVNELPFFDDL